MQWVCFPLDWYLTYGKCIDACEGDDSFLILKKKKSALCGFGSPPRMPFCSPECLCCHLPLPCVCHLLLGITSPAGSWLGWQLGLLYPLLIPLLLLAALLGFVWFRSKFHIVAQIDQSSLCTLGWPRTRESPPASPSVCWDDRQEPRHLNLSVLLFLFTYVS